MAINIKGKQMKLTSSKSAGPGRLCTEQPVSPRRLFRHYSYPKRLTKTAASYLHNIQALLASYVPWMTHLQLCVYHIWALIWALSRPWSCPMWLAHTWLKPFVYCILRQWCFLVEWIQAMLCSHNWRGALSDRRAASPAWCRALWAPARFFCV